MASAALKQPKYLVRQKKTLSHYCFNKMPIKVSSEAKYKLVR